MHITLLALMSLSLYASIPILGVNSQGKFISTRISEADYKKYFASTLKETQKTLKQLNLQQSSRSNWNLKFISFGLGANAEIGFGPFQIGAGIRKRYIFRRK